MLQEVDQCVGVPIAGFVTSHDVYFIFSCTITNGEPAQAAKTKDRATLAFGRLCETVGSYAGDLWEDYDWTVSRDFMPRAAKLLTSPGTTVRTLNPSGLRLANSGSLQGSESGGKLSIRLGRNACSKKALGLDIVPVRIQRLHIVNTSSGISMAVLQLQYLLNSKWSLAQSAQVVLDCNHYLGHPLTHRADSLAWVADVHTDAPRLMGLLRALMMPEGHAPDTASYQRLFAFTAISTTAAPIDTPEFSLLLSRLARKHTVDYLPADGYVRAFGVLKGVQFSVMPEGAALIVSTANESEFSVGYLAHSVPTVYLPVVLLSLLELALLRRLETAILEMPRQEGEARLAVLQSASHEVLQFKLGYRLHAISGIAMHSDFHGRLRSALSLDESLERLGDDMHLAEQKLEADLHQRDEERRRWLTVLATAAAVFTVVHEFFEIGVKLKWEHDVAIAQARFSVDKLGLSGLEHVVSQRHIDEVWGVAVPVLLALLAGAMSWWKKWTYPHH